LRCKRYQSDRAPAYGHLIAAALALAPMGGLLPLVGWEPQTAQAQENPTGGDPKRGAALIQRYGCGTCHTIPGITGADGVVGPPLTMVGRRIYIAGVLRNTPDNLTRWIRDPQKIVPGNAMPDMGITEPEARDLAAFLQTLR
jgi:cytochrome c2